MVKLGAEAAYLVEELQHLGIIQYTLWIKSGGVFVVVGKVVVSESDKGQKYGYSWYFLACRYIYI